MVRQLEVLGKVPCYLMVNENIRTCSIGTDVLSTKLSKLTFVKVALIMVNPCDYFSDFFES